MLREAAFSSTYGGVIPVWAETRGCCVRRCIGGGYAVSTVDVARVRWALGGGRKPRAPRGHLRSEEEDGVELPDLAWVGLTLPGPHFRTRLRGILGSGATPTAQATGKRPRRLSEAVARAGGGAVSFLACWGLGLESRVEFVLSNSPAPAERRVPHVCFLL